MSDPKENLLDWLRDAHAMEEQAEQMLTRLADRIENYPELKSRIERHIEETRRQAGVVRQCIKRCGGDTSTLKDFAGKLMAFGQGMSGLFVSDEVVKGVLASYTFEHMEIASYRILIAAAQECGDRQTATDCELILKEEIAMAEWLEQNMQTITQRFLQRKLADVEAKH